MAKQFPLLWVSIISLLIISCGSTPQEAPKVMNLETGVLYPTEYQQDPTPVITARLGEQIIGDTVKLKMTLPSTLGLNPDELRFESTCGCTTPRATMEAGKPLLALDLTPSQAAKIDVGVLDKTGKRVLLVVLEQSSRPRVVFEPSSIKVALTEKEAISSQPLIINVESSHQDFACYTTFAHPYLDLRFDYSSKLLEDFSEAERRAGVKGLGVNKITVKPWKGITGLIQTNIVIASGEKKGKPKTSETLRDPKIPDYQEYTVPVTMKIKSEVTATPEEVKYKSPNESAYVVKLKSKTPGLFVKASYLTTRDGSPQLTRGAVTLKAISSTETELSLRFAPTVKGLVRGVIAVELSTKRLDPKEANRFFIPVNVFIP